MVLLGRIELPASSLPKQGMVCIKLSVIKTFSLLLACVLPKTHAVPKLRRVPSLPFSYRKRFGPIKFRNSTCAIPHRQRVLSKCLLDFRANVLHFRIRSRTRIETNGRCSTNSVYRQSHSFQFVKFMANRKTSIPACTI